jgi:hypothetical protein
MLSKPSIQIQNTSCKEHKNASCKDTNTQEHKLQSCELQRAQAKRACTHTAQWETAATLLDRMEGGPERASQWTHFIIVFLASAGTAAFMVGIALTAAIQWKTDAFFNFISGQASLLSLLKMRAPSELRSITSMVKVLTKICIPPGKQSTKCSVDAFWML